MRSSNERGLATCPMNVMEAPTRQMNVLEATTHWFHVFKSMFDSGDAARLGPYAFMVYGVLKSHTNISTGRTNPSIETIAAKAGISESQVKRALKILVRDGYVQVRKNGRNNIYQLVERIQITDKSGAPQATATWPYVPSTAKIAVDDVKFVLAAGDLACAKIVHIDKVQVNIVNNVFGGTVINVQQLVTDLDNLPPGAREALKSAFSRSALAQQIPECDGTRLIHSST